MIIFCYICENKLMQQKESKTNWHFNVSLFKSCLRICAGAAIIMGDLVSGGVVLIIAEIFGILEELF